MSLIYTPRHWLSQLVDIMLTVIAWIVFVWLVYGGILDLMTDQGQGPRIEMDTPLLSGLDSLLLYLMLSILVACILIFWATYRKKQAAGFERRKRVPIMSDETLSNSFGVDLSLLKILQQQQVMTVHNGEDGGFLSVEMPALHQHPATRKKQVKPALVGEQP